MSANISEATVRELREQAQKCVELCRRAGADAAEVLVRDGSELTVKIRLGEPELVQEAGSRALGLRVFKDGRREVTYTSDLRDQPLAAFVKDRYASWDAGIGREIERGRVGFAELEKYAQKLGEVKTNQSGRQEMLENLINEYI